MYPALPVQLAPIVSRSKIVSRTSATLAWRRTFALAASAAAFAPPPMTATWTSVNVLFVAMVLTSRMLISLPASLDAEAAIEDRVELVPLLSRPQI